MSSRPRIPSLPLVLAAAGLLVAIAWVYFRVPTFTFLYWDDNRLLMVNKNVQSLNFNHLRWMFADVTYNRLYMPLGWLGIAISVAAFGLAPDLHHVLNVVLHGINAILVLAVIVGVLRRTQAGVAVEKSRVVIGAAFFGALIWALHPLRVEVGAWFAARVHSMAAIPALLSVWIYVRYAGGHEDRRGYWGAVGLYAASVLIFPSALMLPAVFFILDLYVLNVQGDAAGGKKALGLLLGKWPFLAVAIIPVLAGFWGRVNTTSMSPSPTLAQFGIAARVAQACYVWIHYLVDLVYPLHLAPIYDRLATFSPSDAVFVMSAAAVVIATVVGFMFRRAHPYLWAAWLCHLVILVPFLGITEHPHNASDRYSYLEGIIWSCVLSALFVRAWEWRKSWMLRGPVLVLCTCIIFTLAVAAREQTKIWENDGTLFRYVLSELHTHPFRAQIHWRLGRYYRFQHESDNAAEQFAEAVEINPLEPNLLQDYASLLLDQAEAGDRSLADRSEMYLRAGRAFDAQAHYLKDLVALRSAAYCYFNGGDSASAEDRVKRALTVDPTQVDSRLFLAHIYFSEDKRDEALRQLDDTIKAFPNARIDRERVVAEWTSTSQPSGAH